MSLSTSISSISASSQNIPPPAFPEIPAFLQTAGIVTKLFFATLAAIGGVGCFSVGIAFTPFSQNAGIAAFTSGTFLFGLSGILLYNALAPAANPSPITNPSAIYTNYQK